MTGHLWKNREVFLCGVSLLTVLTLSGLCSPLYAEEQWSLELRYPATLRAEPFSGRVTIFCSAEAKEPRLGPNWLQPEPLISLDVVDWQPDQALSITAQTPGLLRFPRDFVLDRAKHPRVQVVARFNPWERQVGTGVGNAYSSPLEWPAGDLPQVLNVTLDHLVPERAFQESTWSKLCAVPSQRLTEFHQRPVSVRAGVILPASYHDAPERRYPVIITIPGFGGSHFSAERQEPVAEANREGVEFLRVILDPSCPEGHHVFADSANNGPWGSALVADWLPEFERRFRVAPRGRFLTGHSSGGWSSLWLQVTHPEVFDGVWSTAPDPVDFRDFQQVDIYRTGENAWIDPAGNRRPIVRRGSDVLVWWDDFDRMEQVLGHGGQFQSFEAVFSPRLPNGRPRQLWDRTTGAVDPVTAEAWTKYDIDRVLRSNWPNLKAPLAGKLHVFMGSEDTFYLTGATQLLQTTLKDLGSDAVVEIHEGKDHRTLLDGPLRDRLRAEMTERFLVTR